MAEVFGIVAGAAGFVSLLIQVISGIDTLRDISNRADEASAELASLVMELTCEASHGRDHNQGTT